MVALTTALASLSLLTTTSLAFPAPVAAPAPQASGQSDAGLPAETVYTFPVGTWMYSLAMRSNGDIISTTLQNGTVFKTNPADGTTEAIHTFDGTNAITGVAEVNQPGSDLFAFGVGSVSDQQATLGGVEGSWGIWTINFGCDPPEVAKVVDLPEAKLLNGFDVLDTQGNIMVPDAPNGLIYRVNVNTGEAVQAITGEKLMAGAPNGGVLGVSQVRVYNGKLYYTNAYNDAFAALTVNSDGTAATGSSLVANVSVAEKFDISPDGTTVWFGGEDELRSIPLAATNPPSTVLSTGAPLKGNTCVKLGKAAYSNTLFFTTNGGSPQFQTGQVTQPGVIAKVELGGGY